MEFSTVREVEYDRQSVNPFSFSEKIFCFLVTLISQVTII